MTWTSASGGEDEPATAILSGDAAAAYPNMAAFTAGHVLQEGYDFAQEFEWGLELVLDGLERALDAA